jgi:hypothetical protein
MCSAPLRRATGGLGRGALGELAGVGTSAGGWECYWKTSSPPTELLSQIINGNPSTAATL